MTNEELDIISKNVAEILFSKISRSVSKKLEIFIQNEYNKLHPEKLLSREQFLKIPENKFYNYKTKKQINSIQGVNEMKKQAYMFPNDKLSRYYATETQFYAMKRKVKLNQHGIKYSIRSAGGFVSSFIYNYHQTEPIPDDEYVEPMTRAECRKITSKKRERKAFFARHNFTCNLCKKIYPYHELEIDHIIPISLGGKNTQANWQCLCKQCNTRKGSKILK